MAYKTANLNMVAQPFGGAPDAPRFFSYLNGDADTDATITGTNWVSDGVIKGVRVGDIVDAVNVGTAKYKRYQCTASQTFPSTGVTLSGPTAIT